MSNVVELKLPDIKRSDLEDIKSLMEHVTQWCSDRGVDASSREYIYDAAVIMISLQSILYNREK